MHRVGRYVNIILFAEDEILCHLILNNDDR